MAIAHEKRMWITDERGHVYSDRQWAEHLKARHDRWRETMLALKVVAYLAASTALGSALLVPEIDNRTIAAIAGAAALAFAIGLTVGSWERSEPSHKMTFAHERPGMPPPHMGWEDFED